MAEQFQLTERERLTDGDRKMEVAIMTANVDVINVDYVANHNNW